MHDYSDRDTKPYFKQDEEQPTRGDVITFILIALAWVALLVIAVCINYSVQ